jgi:hypothetical protein
MTNLGVADLTIRQANRQSRRVKDRSEALSRQTIQVWSIRKRDRVAIASRGYSPPIENDENYRANLCAKLEVAGDGMPSRFIMVRTLAEHLIGTLFGYGPEHFAAGARYE